MNFRGRSSTWTSHAEKQHGTLYRTLRQFIQATYRVSDEASGCSKFYSPNCTIATALRQTSTKTSKKSPFKHANRSLSRSRFADVARETRRWLALISRGPTAALALEIHADKPYGDNFSFTLDLRNNVRFLPVTATNVELAPRCCSKQDWISGSQK